MMKRSFRYIITGGLLVGIGVLAVAYFVVGSQSYEARGRVAGIEDDGRTLVVEHEEIPGYMPPMVMPLPVSDPDMTAQLESGAAIQFEMTVSQDSTWISAVEQLPDSAVARNPAQTIQPLAGTQNGESQTLREGDRLPADLTLTDHTGAPVEMEAFRGQALVLTFIYTQCPLPDYCPLMSKQFAALQPILREEFGDRAHLLSISFDPANDTPKVLREYADRYTDRLDTWTFATGDTSQVQRATRLFGVFTKSADGEITHNLVTAVVAPDGTIQRLFRGNDWKPDDVTQVIEKSL